jgi:hypothetical protein
VKLFGVLALLVLSGCSIAPSTADATGSPDPVEDSASSPAELGGAGAKGDPGDAGLNGLNGDAGINGLNGAAGIDGVQGLRGVPGVDAESPARVIWVADDETGDYALLSTALDAITDASFAKPYLIKIAPGTYIEKSTVVLKNFVDVEGSGQGITTITCACADDNAADAATLSADRVVGEIRHLTINNTGTDVDSVGVHTTYVTNGSFSMFHVTATATGSNFNTGVYNDFYSSPSMNNVTATATGDDSNWGVYNVFYSSPSMNNVTATAAGGSSNTGVYNGNHSQPTIRNSSITGSTYSILLGANSSTRVADTMLDGDASGIGFACVGVYTSAFSPLGDTCG